MRADRIHRSLVRAALVAGLLLVACVGPAATADEDGEAPRVYFLGVDTEPAGDSVTALAPAGDEPRWGFSDFGRRALRAADAPHITHDLADWRPLDDPFNAGVIVVKSVRVWPESYDGIAFREYATADVEWIHIGQDLRGVGMAQAFPEVRASIAHYYTDFEQQSSAMSLEQRRALMRRTIEQAIEQLARRVAEHQGRSVLRRASEIRYVTMMPAPVHDDALGSLSATYGDHSRWLAGMLSERIAQLTEWMLMDRLLEARKLDHVVFLPGRTALEVVTRVWPAYARRIFANSDYSGARRILGDAPPRLRAVGAVCEQGRDPRLVEVPGWHLRTTLATLDTRSSPMSKYVSAHEVHLRTAAALRVPLTTELYLRGGGEPKPTLGASESLVLEEPNQVTLGEALTERHLNELLAQSIARTLPAMVEQLVALKNLPAGPDAYRKHCHDNT